MSRRARVVIGYTLGYLGALAIGIFGVWAHGKIYGWW